MPDESLRLCLGCMNYINAEETSCKICGTNKYEENNADELRRGSLLDNRFFIGKAIKFGMHSDPALAKLPADIIGEDDVGTALVRTLMQDGSKRIFFLHISPCTGQ